MVDYKISITDQDAIDGINSELNRIIANGGSSYATEEFLVDFITTQMRQAKRNAIVEQAQNQANAMIKAYDDALSAKIASAKVSVKPTK